MPVKAIIFDCDGTLVDSETLAAEVIVAMLAERGHRLCLDSTLREFRGCRFAHYAEMMCLRHPEFDVDSFTTEFRARSLYAIRARLRPMDGALELVSRLEIDKCVASNGPRQKIETSLQVTGLLRYFSGRIVSAYELGSWKPAPALIEHAAALMGISPQDCLLVEDSLAGIEAGLAAGVRVAGFRLDARRRSQLGAKITLIEHLSQIHDLLD